VQLYAGIAHTEILKAKQYGVLEVRASGGGEGVDGLLYSVWFNIVSEGMVV